MSRALLLSAFLLAGAEAQDLRDIGLADVKAAIAAGRVAAPPAAAAAPKTNGELIAEAREANRRIGFLLQRLDHALPWPKSQVVWGEATRIQLECERATAGVQEKFVRLQALRESLEGGAKTAALAAELRSLLALNDAAIEDAIPESRSLTDYGYYIEDLKKSDPRAKDLVAHMGMVASAANLQRAALEMRKEAQALMTELQSQGDASFALRDFAAIDYESNLNFGRSHPWRQAGGELDGVGRAIGPDNAAAARTISSLRVFDAPASR
ncbi:MAG: hypothetical protein HY077_17035 [Elusimicrobia bacterium]|nr:hypothetical protein [Elusimicrobiota bacterium]